MQIYTVLARICLHCVTDIIRSHSVGRDCFAVQLFCRSLLTSNRRRLEKLTRRGGQAVECDAQDLARRRHVSATVNP